MTSAQKIILLPTCISPRSFPVHAVYFLLLTSSFLLSLPSSFAAKEALLIANADYTSFGKLPNPIPDARKLADSLRQIGFQVALVENADREQMLEALGSFEERLKASRGIAFFHYGGHGVQVNGRNYLIPANADIPDEKRVATRAVELDEVMTALDASGSTANIVVLDACRDNPLPASTRSATRGLSVVQAKPKNSIIIFAAEAGSKAQDGLFTPILANAITAPGRSITDVVMQVRRQVNEQSGGTQIPGEYNQLFDPIVLNGDSQLPPPPQPAATPYQPPQIFAPPEPDEFELAYDKLFTKPAEKLIRSYYQAIQGRNDAAVANYFADQVDYYSSGTIPKSKVIADIRGDWKRYSGASYSISNFQSLSPSSCQFILVYSLMQGDRPRRGKLQMNATLTSDQPQKIQAIKAKVISAK